MKGREVCEKLEIEPLQFWETLHFNSEKIQYTIYSVHLDFENRNDRWNFEKSPSSHRPLSAQFESKLHGLMSFEKF